LVFLRRSARKRNSTGHRDWSLMENGRLGGFLYLWQRSPKL